MFLKFERVQMKKCFVVSVKGKLLDRQVWADSAEQRVATSAGSRKVNKKNNKKERKKKKKKSSLNTPPSQEVCKFAFFFAKTFDSCSFFLQSWLTSSTSSRASSARAARRRVSGSGWSCWPSPPPELTHWKSRCTQVTRLCHDVWPL